MKSRFSILAAAAIAAVVGVTPAFAEDVWVKVLSSSIRSNKGGIYPSVVDVKKGDKLTVLSREGLFLKVSFSGKEGWIASSSVSNSQIGGDLDFGNMGDTAAMNSSKSIRGLDKDAQDYAAAKKIDPKPMEALEKFRDSIKANPAEWEAFMKAGAVGTHASEK